uniref:Glycosyltransferase n=1 Tax=Oryza meridionalis TaxID=40149 RepID=A0A0E0CKN9_9ORYZ
MADAPAAHAVFFPFPAQGHVAPALHLAKLLHARGGVRVTFVHSERNHRSVLRSRGATALDGAPGFRFAAVPDGLPPAPPPSESGGDDAAAPRTGSLVFSIRSSGLHFKKLVDDAALSGAPVTCVVSDVDVVLVAAREMGLPAVALWTASACAFMAFLQFEQLIDRDLIPLKDAEQLSNGHLDRTLVDWVPGMPTDMRLRDFMTFIRTTDPDDAVVAMFASYMEHLRRTSSAIVINTFDELEGEVLAALSRSRVGVDLPPVYTVGPLPQLAAAALADDDVLDAATMGAASLWPEDGGCLVWLQGKKPRSVLYVNFGSIIVLSREQLVELAWGLARSGHHFLWVIREDQAKGVVAGGGDPIDMIPPEFAEETKGRGYVTRWCPQEALLRHEAIGAFLTHCGWNSMLDGICNGIPMMCFPMFADQPTNCRYARTEWRIGVEIGDNIEREEVARLVREVMEEEKGGEMRQRAMECKQKAAAAIAPGGTSWVNLERLVNDVLSP